MMIGYKKTAVQTMKLVIDAYVRELGEHDSTRFAPPGTSIGSGEYRYYAGHHYFGDRKSTIDTRVTTDDDCWRSVLYEALSKLPDVETDGRPLGYDDWKLEVICSNKAFVDSGMRLHASGDKEDEVARLLRLFAKVYFRLAPPATIEAYLASDKHVRPEE